MIRFALLLLFSCCSFLGFSQEYITVKGWITDAQSKPVPFASVEFISLPDSTVAKGTITDEEGFFDVYLTKGNYFLLASSVGFSSDKVYFKVEKTTVNLNQIKLTQKEEVLEGVVVQSRRSTFDLQLDKRVFNVGQDLASAGGNATEVLENIPSVTIDGEGNVSLRGSQNVRILINGRPSSLVKDGASLQNLQASMIERVEIITNASARYEAEGDVGILNIILKKNIQIGLNGSINVNAGYQPQSGVGVNLNYRKNKINYFTNLSLNYRESPGTSSTYQKYTGVDTSFVYEQDYKNNRINRRLNALVGADIQFNDYNSLTTSVLFEKGLNSQYVTRSYTDYDHLNTAVGGSRRLEDMSEKSHSFETTLNYRKTFAKSGKEWITQLSLNFEKEREQADFTENFIQAGVLPKTEKSDVLGNERNIIFQSDFVNTFGENGRFEFGTRVGMRTIETDFGYGQLLGGAWQYPSRFNDDFTYDEKVIAAYGSIAKQFNKISAMAGLRAEYSDITTEQKSNIANNSNRDYINLFPSATISYAFEQRNSLQVSYSRRIRRPGQWDLLPYTSFGDNREIRNGNAFLNPEFTDSYEISYLQSWEKGSVLGSVYHRHKTGVIERILVMDPSGIILITPQNLSTENSYGVETNLNYDVAKWLRFTTNFNFFRAITDGAYNGKSYDADTYTWTNRTSANLSAGKWRGQTAFNYTAPRKTTQGKNLSTYHLDFGISRLIFNGKGNIVFNVRDVFNTRKWRSNRDKDGFYSVSEMQWRPRTFNLTFTFRINQKFDAKKERDLFKDDGGGGEGQ